MVPPFRPAPWRGVIDAYRPYLPVSPSTPVVTLLEGNTALLYSKCLTQRLGPPFAVYLKYEGMNPTGSFKDRGMTVAVSKAVEEGARTVVCASTGNTAASAAAHAARAGLRCVVILPDGQVAAGKLAQSLIHGAEVLAIRGNFDRALELARQVSEELGLALVNSVNPYRIAGQKTAAFEVEAALGRPPDFQFMPVGNAGNITAYWMGYQEVATRQGLDDLEGGRLLALEAVWVHRVDQGEAEGGGGLLRQGQGLVEVAADRDDLGAVDQGLGELARRDLSLGKEDDAAQAGAGGVGRRRGRGVARRGAKDAARPFLERLRHGERHAAVLERAGRVESLEFEMEGTFR